MRSTVPNALWLAPALALALPPLLLIPFVFRLPAAQVFKDFYEACLWITPAIGVAVLLWYWRLRRQGTVTLRQPGIAAGVTLACLDLASPVFFYVLLAILAGH